MNIHAACEEFFSFCFRKGLSEKTLVSYRSRLALFLCFIADLDDMNDLADISEHTLAAYSTMVLQKKKQNTMLGATGKISRETSRTYLNILRVFLNWTDSKGYTERLASYITLPKRHKKLVAIYSDDEIALIWHSFENHASWVEKRNKACIALMYDSGLRLSECLGLRPEDLRYEQKVCLVTGKGQKQRYVPFSDFAQSCVRTYLAACPKHDNEVIFINFNLRPLSIDNVEQVFYRMRKKLGLRVSPHNLRHNFATNYLIMQYETHGRADIYQLMLILGHSDVRTCEIYIHMAQQVVLGKVTRSKMDSIADKLTSP